MEIKKLVSNIRFYVLLISALLSGGIYLWVALNIHKGMLQLIRLQQLFAFIAIVYVYLALLAGPFCYTFNNFPYTKQYLKARRALGVSAFYFAFLHTYISFFYQLGGFAGLGFLSQSYIIPISCSVIALTILFLLTITSFDFMVEKMTFPKWKLLHRFIYLAGILILIHAVMLGTHFSNLSGIIPQLLFFALVFLLVLEEPRLYKFIKKGLPEILAIGIRATLVTSCILVVILYIVYEIIDPLTLPSKDGITFDIHAAHRQLAQQAQQQKKTNFPSIAGLKGDPTKRFNVNFVYPENVITNQDTVLSFHITNATNGNQIKYFEKVYEKPMHLIIVDNTLSFFNHIHPTQTEDGFTITTQFPTDGLYHIYIDFQPFGAIEQQFAFTLSVGNYDTPTFSIEKPDTNLTKVFGVYQVTLTKPTLIASEMSLGNQIITFTIADAKTKKPVKTIKPYLGAFGHMVMINQKTFEYLHVHPTSLTIPKPNDTTGPTVEFMPIGIYGPFSPGIYKVFTQLNPDDYLFTADFTVEVK